jgi:thiamine pyrophosphate-dependent acetolactate synthase large subunit-like protein
MNIQELHTMATKTKNLKLIILDSNGYLAISLMQKSLFGGRFFGSSPDSGVSSPNFESILEAYGIKAFSIKTTDRFTATFSEFLSTTGACALIVQLPNLQVMRPRSQTRVQEDGSLQSSGLGDMWPFI